MLPDLPTNGITAVIGLAVSLVGLIAAWQFAGPWVRRWLMPNTEARTAALLMQHRFRLEPDAPRRVEQMALRLLRVAHGPEEVVLLVVNDGAPVLNVRVEVDGGAARWAPVDGWARGESGYMAFDTLPGREPDVLTFTLRFEDAAGRASTQRYRCDVHTRTLVCLP